MVWNSVAVLLSFSNTKVSDENMRTWRDRERIENFFKTRLQRSYSDSEEEDEQAEFFVALSEGVAETLEPCGVSGQLEDPDDPHDPEELSDPPDLHQVPSHVLPDQRYRDVVREDGQEVDNIHRILDEFDLGRTSEAEGCMEKTEDKTLTRQV